MSSAGLDLPPNSPLYAGSISHLFNYVKGKIERSGLLGITRLPSLFVKLFTLFHFLWFEFWRRPSSVYPSPVASHNASSCPPAVEDAKDDDRVLPCIERLQRLEQVFGELSNKPAAIPLEKEKILLESLDRIKSVESDLEKTKRVCSV